MATLKQKKAIANVVENGGNVSRAMMDAGYTPATANTPQKLTESKAWKEIMEESLPDNFLAEKHVELLNSSRIDHMVFPLGPKDEDDINFSGAKVKKEGEDKPEAKMPEEYKERTTLTDKEIIEMLAEVNCKVRRIVHGETARHVYFWAADNMARDKALDKAYKLKGSYAAEKTQALNLNIEARLENKDDLVAIREKYEAEIRNKYISK